MEQMKKEKKLCTRHKSVSKNKTAKEILALWKIMTAHSVFGSAKANRTIGHLCWCVNRNLFIYSGWITREWIYVYIYINVHQTNIYIYITVIQITWPITFIVQRLNEWPSYLAINVHVSFIKIHWFQCTDVEMFNARTYIYISPCLHLFHINSFWRVFPFFERVLVFHVLGKCVKRNENSSMELRLYEFVITLRLNKFETVCDLPISRNGAWKRNTIS